MFSYQLCQGRQLLLNGHVQAQVSASALRAVLLPPPAGATYLGMLAALRGRDSSSRESTALAAAYREWIARLGQLARLHSSRKNCCRK
jgi:hypothetical protein